MSAPWLIAVASFLFATMGVCIKSAAAHYSSGEIVMYRGVVGALLIFVGSRWRGETRRTATGHSCSAELLDTRERGC